MAELTPRQGTLRAVLGRAWAPVETYKTTKARGVTIATWLTVSLGVGIGANPRLAWASFS